jgi:hypothetical protein
MPETLARLAEQYVIAGEIAAVLVVCLTGFSIAMHVHSKQMRHRVAAFVQTYIGLLAELQKMGILATEEKMYNDGVRAHMVSRIDVSEGVSIVIESRINPNSKSYSEVSRDGMTISLVMPPIEGDFRRFEEFLPETMLESEIREKFKLPIRFSVPSLQEQDVLRVAERIAHLLRVTDTGWHSISFKRIEARQVIANFRDQLEIIAGF